MRIRRSRTYSSGDLTYNSDLIPDGNHTRDLGNASFAWAELWVNKIDAHYLTGDLDPWSDNARALGDSTHNYLEIYVHDIQGNARALVFAAGLIGG